MQKDSGTTTVDETIADVQFAGRRTGRIDWRSRPAASLGMKIGSQEAVERRIKRGLLLDGIR